MVEVEINSSGHLDGNWSCVHLVLCERVVRLGLGGGGGGGGQGE